MVSSDAKTVKEYIASLEDGRKEAISAVLEMVRENIPEGYEEVMNWGMVCWQVPLSVEPDTYNGEPLMFAGLASQKRHMSLYMMPVYSDPAKHDRLISAYQEMGRKPNMGKSCIRFTKLEHLPLETLGQLIAECDMAEFIAHCK